jgi:sugar (pentulose or hexulose) kinase
MKEAILIFDIGKTNKKCILFDTDLNPLYQKVDSLEETKDEDGHACEDIQALTTWLTVAADEVLQTGEYKIIGTNFCTYGASFVYLNEHLVPIAPLYNYLKAIPSHLQDEFEKSHGPMKEICRTTSSPWLGYLNSGMQIYGLKKVKPHLFEQTKYILHLPQYISAIFTKQCFTDMTSLGSHTLLWDFSMQDYHKWVYKEGLTPLLPPITSHKHVVPHPLFGNIGLGIHDSSAALIPYLERSSGKAILLSTGTWSICFNLYDNSSIIDQIDAGHDVLQYISYEGKPISASRLFLGHEHDEQVKRIAKYFKEDLSYYKHIIYDEGQVLLESDGELNKFSQRALSQFADSTAAYHQLMADLVQAQITTISWVTKDKGFDIFVDGGFAQNKLYMALLSKHFHNQRVIPAEIAQASAIGSAMLVNRKTK